MPYKGGGVSMSISWMIFVGGISFAIFLYYVCKAIRKLGTIKSLKYGFHLSIDFNEDNKITGNMGQFNISRDNKELKD